MPACKVLIIDDDEDIRDSLVGLLRGEGLAAEAANSGVTALALLTWGQFVPDVILLDLLMPSMTGDQSRKVVQKHPRWSHIPIIVCTAGHLPDPRQIGAFGALQKPFDVEQLLSLVKRACQLLVAAAPP